MRNPLRTWTAAVEKYVIEVLSGERRGKAATAARMLLLLLTRLLAVGVKFRRFLFNVRP